MKQTINHYHTLGLGQGCHFREIKQAYYRRVKECHPDLFGGAREKEEEFKILVNAFDVLSDPDKRSKYDALYNLESGREEAPYTGTGYAFDGSSIMDSEADDVLEEFIVGNDPPESATLATLFLDLQKTEIFISFREGKNYFSEKKYKTALHFFIRALERSPGNILYHYYVARSYFMVKEFSRSRRHYLAGIALGRKRIPHQRLERFHSELEKISAAQFSWTEKIASIFRNKLEADPFYRPEEQMVDETNRAIARICAEKRKRAALTDNSKRLN